MITEDKRAVLRSVGSHVAALDRPPMTSTVPVISRKTARRRARIERELRVLRTMEGHLFTRELLWAVLTIPAVAALVILIVLKTHLLSGSPALAAAVAATTGLAVWWIGRRWFTLAAILVFGLILIALEDLPNFDDIGANNAKEQRRIKLERAIARRESMLAQMDGRS